MIEDGRIKIKQENKMKLPWIASSSEFGSRGAVNGNPSPLFTSSPSTRINRREVGLVLLGGRPITPP